MTTVVLLPRATLAVLPRVTPAVPLPRLTLVLLKVTQRVRLLKVLPRAMTVVLRRVTTVVLPRTLLSTTAVAALLRPLLRATLVHPLRLLKAILAPLRPPKATPTPRLKATTLVDRLLLKVLLKVTTTATISLVASTLHRVSTSSNRSRRPRPATLSLVATTSSRFRSLATIRAATSSLLPVALVAPLPVLAPERLL